jgi:large subunit ribosomal protein L18
MSARKSLSAVRVRHERLRKKLRGTFARPRLCVHFSSCNIYAQVIDDESGRTLVSVSTTESMFKGKIGLGANVSTAESVGREAAVRALQKNISKVVFDRGGFLYHGKVKALADAARDGGLNF